MIPSPRHRLEIQRCKTKKPGIAVWCIARQVNIVVMPAAQGEYISAVPVTKADTAPDLHFRCRLRSPGIKRYLTIRPSITLHQVASADNYRIGGRADVSPAHRSPVARQIGRQ